MLANAKKKGGTSGTEGAKKLQKPGFDGQILFFTTSKEHICSAPYSILQTHFVTE